MYKQARQILEAHAHTYNIIIIIMHVYALLEFEHPWCHVDRLNREDYHNYGGEQHRGLTDISAWCIVLSGWWSPSRKHYRQEMSEYTFNNNHCNLFRLFGSYLISMGYVPINSIIIVIIMAKCAINIWVIIPRVRLITVRGKAKCYFKPQSSHKWYYHLKLYA